MARMDRFDYNEFQMNQYLHFFNWNKFGAEGGGLEVTLAAFIFLMLISESSVLLGPF